jgi:diguanylate cyclase (GGDEF)-like protein
VLRLSAVIIVVPAAIGLVAAATFVALTDVLNDVARLNVLAIAVGGFACSFGMALGSVMLAWRLRRLVKSAERLAAGELDHEVMLTRGRGQLGRLSTALGTIGAALRETKESATVDKLTGVSNRQALLGTLFSEIERASRYGRPFSVAFVDIDHFKAVNDTYGHAVGDVVLRGVAQTIRTNLRATDTIGRYGGEEFMLLLTETSPEEAWVLTEKLRTLVARQRYMVEGTTELQVTISIGIAGGVGPNLRVEALVRDADAAMYSAKALGRNQTYVFAEPDEDAKVPRAPISAAGRARAMALGRQAREAAASALHAVVAPLPNHRGQPSAVIASIVSAMATQLDLPEVEIDRIRIAALLHDVGKVAVPEDILEKPAPLTSAEWRTVVQHPRIGQVILEQAAGLKDAAPIILHHHERYSGHGYPFGLRGNDIPLGARIVAIADAYDAMTNDRPYKRALSHDMAIKELRRQAGTQFDPELVGLFCDLYADAAPVPDASVLAMNTVLGTGHEPTEPPLVPPPARRLFAPTPLPPISATEEPTMDASFDPPGPETPSLAKRRRRPPLRPSGETGIAAP